MYSLGYLIQDLLGTTATMQPQARQEIWASDIGKPFVDRFLSMKGVPYSNPATGESLQNFLLGKSAEDAFVDILNVCRIPNETQSKIVIKKDGCLPVTGRLDLLIGVEDWTLMKQRVEESIQKELDREKKDKESVYVYDVSKNNRYVEQRDVRDYSSRIVDKRKKLLAMIDAWQTKYPDGLEKRLIEIKTISQAAMKYHKTRDDLLNAYPHYVMQMYTYLLGLGLEEGTILFIVKGMGKNHSWLEEMVVKRNPKWEKMYWDDIEKFSKFFKENTQPPIEPLFDGKRINWRVQYSSYYDLLYKAEIEKAQSKVSVDEGASL